MERAVRCGLTKAAEHQQKGNRIERRGLTKRTMTVTKAEKAGNDDWQSRRITKEKDELILGPSRQRPSEAPQAGWPNTVGKG